VELTTKAFRFAFEPDSLDKIKKFENWQQILEEELVKAHEKADALLQMRAKKIAPYQSGELYDHFDVNPISPYESTVFNDSPYAWRREEGFSGMTDSLGRYFPVDKGTYYMAITLQMNTTNVGKLFGTALDSALARLGVM
jgi:hypothetical protein